MSEQASRKLAAHRFHIHVINVGILHAALTVGTAGVLVKLIATGKEIAVAAAFGRSDAMDAFLVAFLIPNLLVNLISESMNQALIPTLIRVREREGPESAQRLLSSSMLWIGCLLVCFSVAMAAMAPAIFPLLASNFAPAKLVLAEHLFYALLPMVLASGIATNCTAVLNSLDRFTWPALAPAVTSVSVIVAVATVSARFGIWTMVYAIVFGSFLHAVIVAGQMQAHGYRFSLRWHGHTAAMREVGRQYGPVLMGGVVASSGLLVDQSMAAWLPAGSVSALVYANRFVGVVLTLMAGAISTAVVPSFSRMVAYQDWAGCRATVSHWVRRTLLVSTAVTIVLIACARPLVRVALQHGAFGAADTAVVSVVLAMYAIQIPFYVSSRVYYRLIISARRTDLIFYGGIINLVLDVVLNLVLMHWFGVAGIALATSLWTVSTFIFLRYWALRLMAQGMQTAA